MAIGPVRKWLKRLAKTIAWLIGTPVVLLLVTLILLTIPAVQQKVATMAARIVSARTGLDVQVGHFSVRAPFNILLEDLYVGRGPEDTVAYIGCMDAKLEFKELPDYIAVKSFDLTDVVAHTGDVIPSLKIDGNISRLSAAVSPFHVMDMYFPVTDAILEDSDISLELIEKEPEENAEDSAQQDDSSEAASKPDDKPIIIDLQGLSVKNVGFRLAPTDLDLKIGGAETSVRIDLGASCYTVRTIDVDSTDFSIGGFALPVGKLSGDFLVDLGGNVIKSEKAYISVPEMEAEASLSGTFMDLEKMLVRASGRGNVAGSAISLDAGYDIGNEAFKAELDLGRIDLAKILSMPEDEIVLAGRIKATGKGIDPTDHKMTADVSVALDSCRYNDIDVSGIALAANVDKGATSGSVVMRGIDLSANADAHLSELLASVKSPEADMSTVTGLESFIASIPGVNAELKVQKDNPLRGLLQKNGFDLDQLHVLLRSDGKSRNLDVTLRTPELTDAYKIPAINAELATDLRCDDSTMALGGSLKLRDLEYDGKHFGDKTLVFDVRPDSGDPDHLVANARLDELPVALAKQFVELPEEIGLQGEIMARAEVTGLPAKADVFAAVKPVGLAAQYKPYDVNLCLSEQEITMKNGRVDLNGLRLVAADSTSVQFTGGMDLATMRLDVKLNSDGFEPAKLPKDGPIPVYGKLIAGIDGSITGPVDSMQALVDIHVLPQTDITYPIDKKNLAQVNPEGTVKVGFSMQDGLDLGGRIDVPKGKIFYSPKLYPMMPFNVDNGSCIAFNGPIDSTRIAISASQKAKATYKPVGEPSRMVDFITGVKVGGKLDNINIGFYLDAPKDIAIQRELALQPEENREGLAAVLLATGMYASESNEAAQMSGYALSSIIQSKLNAVAANKLGDVVNLDFGVAKGKHGRGIETTDYTLNVSKSFFNDRLSIRLGGSVSDNAEVNKNAASFFNNLSAEYKLDTLGRLKARIFSMRDYNNIVDGELIKSGAGVLYDRTFSAESDSLDRSLDLQVEGNLVYRSNNQLGPDAAVSISKRNLFNRDDVFTTKVKGAYYWNLNQRQQGDPTRNDTYNFGADFSLSFPYLQLGDNARKYIGSTLYRLGYLNENISGMYGMNKFYGGLDYSLRQNKYITHSLSPLSLSVVLADKSAKDLPKDLSYEDLLKLFAGNEFVPSVGYSFGYNNYRDKNKVVNTSLEIRVKESANLISGIMVACGRDFNEKKKTLLGVDYDQFVKLHFELRNKFRLAERWEIATRALAGAVITYGNSVAAPLSEAYSIGGPNSLRAFTPRTLGPGDFNTGNYSSQVFHKGDIKLEMNAELRFPIFWKINGAVFVDAGNIWNQRDPRTYMSEEDINAMLKAFNLKEMFNSTINPATFLNQIALGTGAGLRLDYESIVIRLDLGIAIHAPFETSRSGYYNIPNFWRDGMKLNFGIGYPF